MGKYKLLPYGISDYALIQGVVLFTAIVFVVVNLIVDIVYTIINPKVNYESGNGGKYH